MNVGASAPWDPGLYFSWANVVGVSADDAAAVAAMTEAAYATSHGASINRDLSFATEDAAQAIMGQDWVMPSDEDIQELIDECTWTWTTIGGVNGFRVSSKAAGNSNAIFLPAGGSIIDGELSESNQHVLYWSTKYHSATEAQDLYASGSASPAVNTNERFCGCLIRAIRA